MWSSRSDPKNSENPKSEVLGCFFLVSWFVLMTGHDPKHHIWVTSESEPRPLHGGLGVVWCRCPRQDIFYVCEKTLNAVKEFLGGNHGIWQGQWTWCSTLGWIVKATPWSLSSFLMFLLPALVELAYPCTSSREHQHTSKLHAHQNCPRISDISLQYGIPKPGHLLVVGWALEKRWTQKVPWLFRTFWFKPEPTNWYKWQNLSNFPHVDYSLVLQLRKLKLLDSVLQLGFGCVLGTQQKGSC